MFMVKKWNLLFTTAIFFISCLGTAYADTKPLGINQIPPIPDVVARVNGSDISAKHIKFQFMQALKRSQVPITSPQKDKIVREVIDKEVVRELMYQEGQKLNLIVDPNIIETELQALKSAYKNEDDFKKALLQRGITEDDLKKSIEVDSQAQTILKQQVKGMVRINDSLVENYYKDNKENFRRPTAYRASHVLIMPFSPELIKNSKIEDLQNNKEELRGKAREKILEIQAQLESGVEIAELAKKYSHDESTSKNGGDLGFFYAEAVEKSFADAVAKLKVGEISEIVETKFGFHLIKLIETKSGEYAPFSDMKGAIQEHLFMEGARDRVSDYIVSLRKKAEIEIFY
jgi:parvulin-like peptidyl-prolyl isomerase